MLRMEQASASKSALTNNLNSNGRCVVALREEDNLLHCPLCTYTVSPLKAKKMNCHTCPANKLTDSSTGTAASSSNRPHTLVQILPSNSPPPDPPAAVYMANLWHDEHWAKFSLAIDTNHCVLVCQWHKVVINGSIQAIENHIKHHSHPTSGFHLSVPDISQALDRWCIHTEMPQRPMHAVVPISGIEPPRDGYQCPECSYAVRADDAVRKHTNSSGGHKMMYGQVQCVQNICWKILPEEDCCHEPEIINIWLTSLKFCMKIVACHKVRSDYLAQRDASGVFPSTALRDDE